MTAPRCPCCGVPLRKATTRERGTVPKGDPIPPYQGNQTVISTTRYRYGTNLDGWCRSLWDGHSYAAVAGHFCTLRCAARYGRAAYEQALGR